MGKFNFSKTEPLLYSPPEITSTECVIMEFYCLVSIDRWGFDESSKIYLRFVAPELGTFYTCHGPMTPTQRFVYIISYMYQQYSRKKEH